MKKDTKQTALEISAEDLRPYFPEKSNVSAGNIKTDVPRETLPWNSHHTRHKVIGEVNKRPSKTVPDQAMSIKEIMNRFVHNMPLGGAMQTVYNGDDDPFDGINPLTLDLVELDEIRQATNNTVKDLTEKLKKSQIEKPKVLETTPTNVDQGTKSEA